MKRLVVTGFALGVIATFATWVSVSNLRAQNVSSPCSVNGAVYPELIPEYFVWEFFFRSRATSALGTESTELANVSTADFHPNGITNIARMDLKVPDQDARTFLEVGLKAVQKADSLRGSLPAQVSHALFRNREIEAAEAILDARDELARRLSVKSFQAVRHRLPRQNTVFDFPPKR